MRVLVALSVLAVVLCGVSFAEECCDKPLSPEAQALKAKYDEKFKALQDEFAAELAAMSARVSALEKPAPATKKWYEKSTINGYFQARMHTRDWDMQPNERDEFEIRRLYLNLIVPFDNKSTGVVTWAGVGPSFREGASGTYENIFVDYKPAPNWTIRAGQGPNWFGLDAAESSMGRMNPERAVVAEGVPGVASGLFAFGPSDRGVWATWDGRSLSASKKEGPRATVGVCNGQFQDTDKNNDKNVSVDVAYFTDWGQFGLSWLDGSYTRTLPDTTVVTEPRDAWGVNVRVLPDTLVENIGFQAEYIDGEWLGTERDGFYVQGSYHFDNHPGIAYVRYEQFDPNSNAADVPVAAAGSANNEIEIMHLGYVYNLTPIDKITVEYGYGEQGSAADMDDFVVQYQRSL